MLRNYLPEIYTLLFYSNYFILILNYYFSKWRTSHELLSQTSSVYCPVFSHVYRMLQLGLRMRCLSCWPDNVIYLLCSLYVSVTKLSYTLAEVRRTRPHPSRSRKSRRRTEVIFISAQSSLPEVCSDTSVTKPTEWTVALWWRWHLLERASWAYTMDGWVCWFYYLMT